MCIVPLTNVLLLSLTSQTRLSNPRPLPRHTLSPKGIHRKGLIAGKLRCPLQSQSHRLPEDQKHIRFANILSPLMSRLRSEPGRWSFIRLACPGVIVWWTLAYAVDAERGLIRFSAPTSCTLPATVLA